MCLLSSNINISELIFGREITDDVVNFWTTQKLYDRRMESEKFWRKATWIMVKHESLSRPPLLSELSPRRESFRCICYVCEFSIRETWKLSVDLSIQKHKNFRHEPQTFGRLLGIASTFPGSSAEAKNSRENCGEELFSPAHAKSKLLEVTQATRAAPVWVLW